MFQRHVAVAAQRVAHQAGVAQALRQRVGAVVSLPGLGVLALVIAGVAQAQVRGGRQRRERARRRHGPAGIVRRRVLVAPQQLPGYLGQSPRGARVGGLLPHHAPQAVEGRHLGLPWRGGQHPQCCQHAQAGQPRSESNRAGCQRKNHLQEKIKLTVGNPTARLRALPSCERAPPNAHPNKALCSDKSIN